MQQSKGPAAAATASTAEAAAGTAQPATATLAGRLEASCQQVIASLPTCPRIRPAPPATPASAVSAGSGTTHKSAWTSKTGRSHKGSTATSGATTRHRQPLLQFTELQQQQQQPLGGTENAAQDVQGLYSQHASSLQSQSAANVTASTLSSRTLQQLDLHTAQPARDLGQGDDSCGAYCGSKGSSGCSPAPSIPRNSCVDAPAALAAGIMEWQQQASASGTAAAAPEAVAVAEHIARRHSGNGSATAAARTQHSASSQQERLTPLLEVPAADMAGMWVPGPRMVNSRANTPRHQHEQWSGLCQLTLVIAH